jgi:hypothetical protein
MMLKRAAFSIFSVLLPLLFFRPFLAFSLSMSASLTDLPKHAQIEQKALRDILAAYDNEPRNPSNNRVEVAKIISSLKNASINTYNFLLWHAPKTDYEDFISFLEAAYSAGIYVWADITPPSEPPHAEPHGMDYVAWAKDFANLSLKYPNFVAFTIDDFDGNLGFFTPQYVKEMREAYQAINPALAFIPTVYGGEQISTLPRFKDFIEAYGEYVDGILVPYIDLDSTENLPRVLSSAREALVDKILVAFIYASPTSWHPGWPTIEYLAKALTISYLYADGVMAYLLPLIPEQSHYEEYLLVQKIFPIFSQRQDDRKWLVESLEVVFSVYDVKIKDLGISVNKLQSMFYIMVVYSILITTITIISVLKILRGARKRTNT